MMSQVILNELRVAVVAFFSGALITIVYDVIRIFRRLISHGNFLIGVEDFLFWMWTALWIFSVLYRENDGNLRMYTLLFMAVGMIFYHKTLSGPLVGIFGKAIKKLKKVLSKIIMKLTHNRLMRPWRGKHGIKDESKKKT